MRSRAARVGLWAFGVLAFGYFALGPILYSLFIGLDWAAYPAGPLIEKVFRGLGYTGHNAISGVFWLLLGVLAVIVVTFVAARGRVRADTDPARRRLPDRRGRRRRLRARRRRARGRRRCAALASTAGAARTPAGAR